MKIRTKVITTITLQGDDAKELGEIVKAACATISMPPERFKVGMQLVDAIVPSLSSEDRPSPRSATAIGRTK